MSSFDHIKAGLRTLALALALIAAPGLLPATAQEADGRVAEISRDVRVERSGEITRLALGDPIFVGDILRSGSNASAQLEFTEGTRIALGPRSVLRIDEILLRRNGTARKFAVSTIGGAFRFLSGDSPSRAYAIRTPSATMGIRGTAFDISVEGADTTGLLVFDGRVLFCGRERACVRVPGGCNLLSVDLRNDFLEPLSVEEKTARIATNFPFARDQERLLTQFRTAESGCDEPNTFQLASRRAAPAIDFHEDDPVEPSPPDFNPAE